MQFTISGFPGMRYFSLDRRLVVFSAVRTAWMRHARTYTRLAIVLLAIYAAFKLADEFPRLMWDQKGTGAIDLHLFHNLVKEWFAGNSIYTNFDRAVYPPSTWVMLYPFLGWLTFEWSRLFWAATMVAALIWLIFLIAKYSGTQTPTELALVSLFLLAMNATGVTIGVGQLILPLLPFLIVGVFTLRHPASWRRDIIAAACLTLTLIKPNISAPFFWLVLFSVGGWRILGLTAIVYSALTLLAASFQTMPLPVLMNDWIMRISSFVLIAGYGNLSIWVSDLGFGQWALTVSLLALVAVGFWTFRHRDADLWLLLGILAIAARMWTYHDLTDDVLILFPIIALFRIAKFGESVHGDDIMAGLLLTAIMIMMLLPAQIRFYPWPQNFLYTIGHPLIWIIVLVFLIHYTRRELKEPLSRTSHRIVESAATWGELCAARCDRRISDDKVLCYGKMSCCLCLNSFCRMHSGGIE